MPDSKVEVKACRKCGGTARYREDGLWFVECSVCGEYEGPHARKVEAKKMWNIKNTISVNAELRSALEECIRVMIDNDEYGWSDDAIKQAEQALNSIKAGKDTK